MRWKVVFYEGRFLVCRKTWHSPEWMGIDKKDIRLLAINGQNQAVEVYADCSTKELANKLLFHKR
ncbi:hypothetical protein FHS16_003464 [Paenibacillus endophyticus]|uniref:Uncharacterized protein n=1 Tax=Paenibacillus endophyticus TaxID=1294268 RepID=A0A7W5GBX9_9BACL|nr:hypothetical protein [Paenibacillus endophyticus]MBB3153402.1 hypothetical protein [Paenibacillus endophyticus]